MVKIKAPPKHRRCSFFLSTSRQVGLFFENKTCFANLNEYIIPLDILPLLTSVVQSSEV